MTIICNYNGEQTTGHIRFCFEQWRAKVLKSVCVGGADYKYPKQVKGTNLVRPAKDFIK